MPTACTASVWNGTAYSWLISASSRIGFTVPTSLFAHITDTSATCLRRLGQRGAQRLRPHPARGVDLEQAQLGALVLGQPLRGLDHGVVLDRGDEHTGATRVGPAAGPVAGP